MIFESLTGECSIIHNKEAKLLLEANLYFGNLNLQKDIKITKLGYSPDTMTIKYDLSIDGKGSFGTLIEDT